MVTRDGYTGGETNNDKKVAVLCYGTVAPRSVAAAVAFRRALEERLKNLSRAEQVDINRIRRQIAFDRLLARLFPNDAPPWALKGGYALELRFKSARSTIDIDLTLQRVVATAEAGDAVRAIREMLQAAADTSLDDWFQYTIGPPVMDLTVPRTAVHVIPSKPAWMGESSRNSTWTPGLAMS